MLLLPSTKVTYQGQIDTKYHCKTSLKRIKQELAFNNAVKILTSTILCGLSFFFTKSGLLLYTGGGKRSGTSYVVIKTTHDHEKIIIKLQKQCKQRRHTFLGR